MVKHRMYLGQRNSWICTYLERKVLTYLQNTNKIELADNSVMRLGRKCLLQSYRVFNNLAL